MKRISMLSSITLLAVSAFAFQAEEQEIVSRGEVVAVSVEDKTLTVKESMEPPESLPGSMQSGVEREFLVTDETELMAGEQSIQLANIQVGDRVTVHYVLDSGKNVAKSISVSSLPTD